jgi:hypothetical protein
LAFSEELLTPKYFIKSINKTTLSLSFHDPNRQGDTSAFTFDWKARTFIGKKILVL